MNVAIDAVGIREGGGAAILVELLDWLPRVRPDWRWHVFLLDRSVRQFDDPPVGPTVTLEPTRRGNSGFGRIAWVNFYLPRRLRAVRADLLFSFANIGPFLPTIPQVVLCHQPLILFTDAQSDFPWWARVRYRFLRNFVWRGLKHSRSVVVQTDSMRDRLYLQEPKLRGWVAVIPSGYRTLPATATVRACVREKIEGCSRPKLLYVSLLRYHKNHAVLLRSMARIARTRPDARLLLTIDPSAPLTHDVVQLHQQVVGEVSNSDLKNRVVWLGHLTAEEVTFAMKACDVMAFPSLAESFGLPLVEAMAAGCPIAAADLPYAHDVAGPAAAYFDPHDPDAVADCLLELVSDPARRETLRQEGIARRDRFAYPTIAEQFARLFERTVPH